jgi:hypothetical protein
VEELELPILCVLFSPSLKEKKLTHSHCPLFVGTEWGYFIASAPKGHPSLISRLIKPDYVGQVCRKAFPPGELNSAHLPFFSSTKRH